MENLLEKYQFELTSQAIDTELNEVRSNLQLMMTPENFAKSLSFIDLTSLHSTDTPQKIASMVKKVNYFNAHFPEYPLPASICVYPNFAKTIKDVLSVSGVDITTVAGCFPTSQSFLSVKKMECKCAVEDGANEIDIVLALNAFLAENYDAAFNEIKEIKETVGNNTLKVILETGALMSIENIATASFIAMEAGADFIKTSTGKMEPAATPMAAIVMCECIKAYYNKTGRKVGFKAAGGVKTPSDAITYLAITQSILGNEWTTPQLFRLGASGLANNLLSILKGETVSYF